MRATISTLERKHTATEERRIARLAAGIAEADIEEAMDFAVRERITTNFESHYHFRSRLWRFVYDPILTRFKKQMERNTHTLLPCERAKSQEAWTRKVPATRVPVPTPSR